MAIYDATNSTRERRRLIQERCEREGMNVIFVESLCDEATVEANVRATKLDSPDYAGVDPDMAVADFRARIEHYAKVYEPVDEREGSYIKLIDVGRQVIVNQITGYLPSRLVSFLVNLHNVPRPIWLTRHGQAEFNVVERIGGNTQLSDLGRQYAANLKALLRRAHRAARQGGGLDQHPGSHAADRGDSGPTDPAVACAQRDRSRRLRRHDLRARSASAFRTTGRRARTTSSAIATRVARATWT